MHQKSAILKSHLLSKRGLTRKAAICVITALGLCIVALLAGPCLELFEHSTREDFLRQFSLGFLHDAAHRVRTFYQEHERLPTSAEFERMERADREQSPSWSIQQRKPVILLSRVSDSAFYVWCPEGVGNVLSPEDIHALARDWLDRVPENRVERLRNWGTIRKYIKAVDVGVETTEDSEVD